LFSEKRGRSSGGGHSHVDDPVSRQFDGDWAIETVAIGVVQTVIPEEQEAIRIGAMFADDRQNGWT
jgi:hypothetical protein